MRTLLATMLLLACTTGAARIGLPAADTLAALETEVLATATDFDVQPVVYEDLLFAFSGEFTVNDDNYLNLGKVIGLATGFGEQIAQPVASFMAGNQAALLADEAAVVPVEGSYLLELELSESDGNISVAWRFGLREIDTGAFPEARHALGAAPDAATVVIREFSDLQCPHCQNFALNVLPELEQLLAEQPGVRFEFHHLPLVMIHANALPAAEAAECVVAANGGEGFWDFTHQVFERMQAWQALPETGPYFVSLAQELGLQTEGVAQCLEEREQLEYVREAADYAMNVLGLSGTPSVFVDGFQVAAWNQLDSYLEIIALIEARRLAP